MYDDFGVILEKSVIHNLRNITQVFTYADLSQGRHLSHYRPISRIFRIILYHFFKTKVFYYRITNVLLFSISCFLLFILLKKLFYDETMAFISSLLFCVHPINTIPVNYITAHEVMLFDIFAKLSLILFLRFQENPRKAIFYVLSIFFYIISFLTQEIMILIPFYLILILYLLRKNPFKKSIALCLPYCLVTVFYFVLRLNFASLQTNIFDKIKNFNITFPSYIASISQLIGWYVSKLIIPRGIILIWNINPIKENLFAHNIIFVSAILIVLLLLIYFGKRDIKSFALLWFLLGFLPVSVICFFYPPMGLIIEPHWFFFSCIGFFILLSQFLVFTKLYINKKVWLLFLCALLMFFGIKTREYNVVWRNQKSYSQYWLTISPNNHYPNFWLANTYFNERNYSKARLFFTRALINGFMDWEVYVNLGLIEQELGDLDRAKHYFNQALRVHPLSAIAYNNLGIIFKEQNNIPKAQNFFVRAIELNYYLLEPRLNLAAIYEERQKISEAINLYEENLKIDPDEKRSLCFLAKCYLIEGKNPKAVDIGKKVLAESEDAQQLTYLGSIFAQNQLTDMALSLYFKALEKYPVFVGTYVEIGKLYGNLGQFHRAISFWQDGLRLSPEDKVLQALILKAHELMEENLNEL